MTIEEWLVKHHATGYKPEQIVFEGFVASPSKAWSEWTVETFSAQMRYRVLNADSVDPKVIFTYWLDESEVCDFLNEMFPAKGGVI
jgi:hypothetical protein